GLPPIGSARRLHQLLGVDSQLFRQGRYPPFVRDALTGLDLRDHHGAVARGISELLPGPTFGGPSAGDEGRHSTGGHPLALLSDTCIKYVHTRTYEYAYTIATIQRKLNTMKMQDTSNGIEILDRALTGGIY